MAMEIRVWDVSNGDPLLLEDSDDKQLLENELEAWICKSPSILGDELLVIDQQRTIPGVGRLDLLCVDANGQFVVVELKRAMAPREAIAQALDYAAWLSATSIEQLKTLAAEHLQQPLEEGLSDQFGEDFDIDELDPKNHRILIVGTGLDSSAERIIDYLSHVHSIDINALFFRHVRKGSQRLLVRSVLVSDDVQKIRVKRKSEISEAQVLQAGERHGGMELFGILRPVRNAWREQPVPNGGGSFRYWADLPSGKQRVVCGFNVAGEKYQAQGSALDVWIRFESALELSGLSREQLLSRFSEFKSLKKSKNRFWIRLENETQAKKVLSILKSWQQKASGAGA